MPHRRLLHLLKRLKNERDPQRREEIIALGRKALLKWFLVGARHLLKGVIPLNKRDQNFVSKHREDFQIISNAQASDEERKKALLKRGGAGFLGGTIIRHLLKWEEKKKKGRARGPKNLPLGGFVRRGKRRKIPPMVDEEELPLAQSPLALPDPSPPPKKKKSPPKKKKSPPKSLRVRIPLAKIHKTPPRISPNVVKTPVKETKTLAMLKANLAQQKARLAQQRGPIGASRTDDTALPSLSSPAGPILGTSLPSFSDTVIAPKSSSSSTVFEAATPFAPTHTSTAKPPPQKKRVYKCRYCEAAFSSPYTRGHHELTVHMDRKGWEAGKYPFNPSTEGNVLSRVGTLPVFAKSNTPADAITLYSSGEEFDTPVRKGPNIKYTARKTPILVETPKRKGPNIKYTKRKSPPKKKSPKRKGPNIKYTKRKSSPKKKSPKRKTGRFKCRVCGKAFNKKMYRDVHEITEHGDANAWLAGQYK